MNSIGLGAWVSTQRRSRDELSLERKERLGAVGFVWDPITEAWENGFRLFTAYKEEFSDCLVPVSYRDKSLDLYTWVNYQRMNKDKLSEDRLERLNSIGFSWDPTQEVWDFAFKLLNEYKEEFGDFLVPSRYKVKGFSLGAWVGYQRRTRDTISSERRERLGAVGFVWDPIKEAWENGFRLLAAYKDEFGDCLVPAGYKAKGFSLGHWVTNQRKNKDQLAKERIERLIGLGFSWDPIQEAWETNFQLLIEYKGEFGDCLVPKRYKKNGANLGTWVSTQRAARDTISSERKEQLNAVGFFWEVS